MSTSRRTLARFMRFAVPKGRRTRIALVTAVLTVVALVMSTASVVLAAGEVPRGTQVLGIDIGGRDQSSAATVLRAELGPRLAKDVRIKVGDREISVDPATAGIALDVDKTVKNAAKQRVNPFTVLFGEVKIAPVVAVDAEKFAAAIQPHLDGVTVDIERPTITYNDPTGVPTPVATYGKPGKGLAPKDVIAALERDWLRKNVIAVQLSTIHPKHTKADIDNIVKTVAAPAVAAPVTVTTEQGDVTIEPPAIAASLEFNADVAGAIVPTVNAVKLREALGDRLNSFGTPATDAKIELEGGKPVVRPSQPGRGLDLDKLAQPLLDVLAKPGPRTVAGVMGELQPKVTTEAANALGVKEQVSTYTTHFTGGQDRNKNITLVADEVDGAFVKPGETFSLNGYTGERGPAQGYVKAPVIVGGKIKNEYGGGISQFATTLYNAVFFSGLEDTFHRAHGYYLSRYPAGREATIYYPTLDLKFRNDSEFGLLIDTSYTDSSITVTFWSTKRYDIESVSEEPYNHRPVTTVYLEEADCIATEGIPGFDIVVWRIFYQNGTEVKRERVFTKYDAEPKFICGKDPNTPS